MKNAMELLIKHVNKVAQPAILREAIKREDTAAIIGAYEMINPGREVIRPKNKNFGSTSGYPTFYQSKHNDAILNYGLFGGNYRSKFGGTIPELTRAAYCRASASKYLPYAAHELKQMITEQLFVWIYDAFFELMELRLKQDVIIIPQCNTFNSDGLNYNLVNADFIREMGFTGPIITTEKVVDECKLLACRAFLENQDVSENIIKKALSHMMHYKSAHGMGDLRRFDMPGIQAFKSDDIDLLLDMSKTLNRPLNCLSEDDSFSNHGYTSKGILRQLLNVTDADHVVFVSLLREY